MEKIEPMFKVLSPEEIAEVLKKAGHYKASFYVGGEEESIAKEALIDTLRQVVLMLDGIGCPSQEAFGHEAEYCYWCRAIQAIKQSLQQAILPD